MIIRFILILLSLEASRMLLHAGWIANPHTTPDRATIGFSAKSEEGYATIDDALKELVSANRIEMLDLISGFDLMKQEPFQKELFSALERDAPRELKEALKSAGNMHNPKLHQLAEPFRKAVLMTPT